jgi:hypothetical protein
MLEDNVAHKRSGIISGIYIFKPLVIKEANGLFVDFTSHIFTILTCYNVVTAMLRVNPRMHSWMVPKIVKTVPTIRNRTGDMKIYAGTF